MTTNTKQFDTVSKPELEPRHRHAPKQQPEHTPGGSFGPQQAAGNLAVQRMLRGRVLQAKLMVGSPHDPLEAEADRMAEQVVRSSASSASKETRVPATPDINGSENALLRDREASATSERETQVVPPVINEVLSGDDSQPLDRTTRSFMESRFGYDFSRVHVHTGERAAESAQAVNALAYTMGRDVVFGEGQYAPQTSEGKRLLAHELTHVMQQEAGDSPRAVQREGGETRIPPARKIPIKEFISIVKRIEAANPGKNALEIEKLIARTKYDSFAWQYLFPSLSAKLGPQVTAGKGVTTEDVEYLSNKLIVILPDGGEADALHIVVGIVAQAEKQAPGTGALNKTLTLGLISFSTPLAAWILPGSLPADVTQGDVATWLGDVGSAAAYWMTAYPRPSGGKTREDYRDEFAPKSDLLGDIDAIVMASIYHQWTDPAEPDLLSSILSGVASAVIRSGHGASVFNLNKSLSENLTSFYLSYLPGGSREGKFRRFHIFCGIRGFDLSSDGVTLSPRAIWTISKRVQAFTDWFIETYPGTKWRKVSEDRQNEWRWFANEFLDFVQKGLNAEGVD